MVPCAICCCGEVVSVVSDSVRPIDSSPPGSPIPGILQARTLEWVAICFSNAWKWKVEVKSLSLVRLLATPWTAANQALPSVGFSRQEYWSGVPLPSPVLYSRSLFVIYFMCVCDVCVKLLSCAWLVMNPWTVAYQSPLSMEFSRQEYWKGLPLLIQGTFLTQGSNSIPCVSCIGRQILHPCTTWEAILHIVVCEYQFQSPLLSFSSPFSPGNHKFAFNICDYFHFVSKLIGIIFLDSTWKQYHMLFVFLWLTVLSMIIFRFIHVAENSIVSFFFTVT